MGCTCVASLVTPKSAPFWCSCSTCFFPLPQSFHRSRAGGISVTHFEEAGVTQLCGAFAPVLCRLACIQPLSLHLLQVMSSGKQSCSSNLSMPDTDTGESKYILQKQCLFIFFWGEEGVSENQKYKSVPTKKYLFSETI